MQHCTMFWTKKHQHLHRHLDVHLHRDVDVDVRRVPSVKQQPWTVTCWCRQTMHWHENPAPCGCFDVLGVQWKSSPSGTLDWTEGEAVYHPASLPSVALEKSWRKEAGSPVGWYCRCPLLLCGATFPFVCGWCCVPGGAAVSSLFRVVLFFGWVAIQSPREGGEKEGERRVQEEVAVWQAIQR